MRVNFYPFQYGDKINKKSLKGTLRQYSTVEVPVIDISLLFSENKWSVVIKTTKITIIANNDKNEDDLCNFII